MMKNMQRAGAEAQRTRSPWGKLAFFIMCGSAEPRQLFRLPDQSVWAAGEQGLAGETGLSS